MKSHPGPLLCTDCEASGFLNYRAKYLHASCASPSPLYCHVCCWMACFFLRLRLSHREHVFVESRRSMPQVKVIIPHGKMVLVHEPWSAAFHAPSAGTSRPQHPTCPCCSCLPCHCDGHPSFLPSSRSSDVPCARRAFCGQLLSNGLRLRWFFHILFSSGGSLTR